MNEEKISANELRETPAIQELHPLLRSLDLRTGYNNNILIRMLIAAAIIGMAILWQLDLVRDIYIRNQIEGIGYLINGGILVVFAAGLIKLVSSFLRYSAEEAALTRFIKNVRNNSLEPIKRVSDKTIISRRYYLMQGMFEQRVLINHSALGRRRKRGACCSTHQCRTETFYASPGEDATYRTTRWRHRFSERPHRGVK